MLSNMGTPPVDQLALVADLRSEQNILVYISQLVCHLLADTQAHMIHGRVAGQTIIKFALWQWLS